MEVTSPEQQQRIRWTKENQFHLWTTILQSLFEGTSDSVLEHLNCVYWLNIFEEALCEHYGLQV